MPYDKYLPVSTKIQVNIYHVLIFTCIFVINTPKKQLK